MADYNKVAFSGAARSSTSIDSVRRRRKSHFLCEYGTEQLSQPDRISPITRCKHVGGAICDQQLSFGRQSYICVSALHLAVGCRLSV